MANLCSFSMMVKGKKENMEKFTNALLQKGDIWMGRGATADIDWDWDEDTIVINGWCKWSIQSALIRNAVSMEKQRTSGIGNWYFEDIKDVKEVISLWQACEKFNVNMEVFSEESGCCFSEHLKYENGNITNDTTDYNEEYNEESGEWESYGGYDWCFDLLEVA